MFLFAKVENQLDLFHCSFLRCKRPVKAASKQSLHHKPNAMIFLEKKLKTVFLRNCRSAFGKPKPNKIGNNVEMSLGVEFQIPDRFSAALNLHMILIVIMCYSIPVGSMCIMHAVMLLATAIPPKIHRSNKRSVMNPNDYSERATLF